MIRFLQSRGASSFGSADGSDRVDEQLVGAEPNFAVKLAREREVKALLAVLAAELVPPAGTVFVDAGSTCFEVGKCLLAREDVRLVTNSLPLLLRGMEGPATVSALGGRLRRSSLALAGADPLEAFGVVAFDVAFVGASGIDPERGPCTTESMEAAIKATALSRARSRVLVVHAPKWRSHAAVVFSAWTAFTHVVTDARLDAVQRAALSRAGIALIGRDQT